jgi:hypothetical protein
MGGADRHAHGLLGFDGPSMTSVVFFFFFELMTSVVGTGYRLFELIFCSDFFKNKKFIRVLFFFY